MEFADILIIKTTVGSREKALSIQEMLVSKKVAACILIHPIDAAYWWDSKVTFDIEYQLTIKSLVRKKEQCISLLLEVHPYDVPMIVIDTEMANKAYVSWMEDVLQHH